MPNTEMFQRIHKQILNEPRSFDMSGWGYRWHPSHEEAPACGTTACVAGWALILDQNEPHPEKALELFTSTHGEYIPDDPEIFYGFEEAGAEILGISHDAAMELFFMSNSRAIQTVAEYAKGNNPWDDWSLSYNIVWEERKI